MHFSSPQNFGEMANAIVPLCDASSPKENRTVRVASSANTTTIPVAISNAASDTTSSSGNENATPIADDGSPSKTAITPSERRRKNHFSLDRGEELITCNTFSMDDSFMSAGHSHENVAGGGYSSLCGAAFHIFKGNVGAGVFLLPTYYQDAGYLLGTICVALLGALMIDCSVSLLRAKQTIQRTDVKTYPAVVGFVLGDWFQRFAKFSLIFTQFGFCVMFLQYAAFLFASLVDGRWAYASFILLSAIAVTPMTFLTHRLHLLAYASLVAGVFVAVVLTGTTTVDIQHLANHGRAVNVEAAILSPRLLLFLSGHMFSLEGIGVVLPVENSVAPEQRRKYGHIMMYTLVIIVLFYIFFGVLGYLAYGETLQTSVVLALPPSTSKYVMQVLLGLSLVLGFPIQYVPAIQLLDKSLGVSLEKDRNKAYCVRIMLNTVIGVVALCIGGDTITTFASFLGAFAGVHLMITIPTLLALQLDHAVAGDMEKYDYGEYLLLMFRGPYTQLRSRYFAYLLLAVVLSVGGVIATVISLL